MKKLRSILLCAAAAGICWLGFLAWRAGQDRVNLDVTDADLGEVVRALRWQTWEEILVQPGITRKITLQARDLPLAQALDRIASQAECEWSRIYAAHRTQSALRSLRLQIVSNTNTKNINQAWTNYPAFSLSFRRPGLAPFEHDPEPSPGVTYQAASKNSLRVASDLGRFGKALVVLENGLNQPVNLQLADVPLDRAAAVFAKALGAKSRRLYVLRPFFRERSQSSASLPRMEMKALPPDIAQALASGGRVQIKFEAKDGEAILAPLEGDALIPPPSIDPAEEQARLQKQVRENLRDTTPEQRLERLRQIQSGPSTVLPASPLESPRP